VVAELVEFVRYLVTGKFRDASPARSDQKKLARRDPTPGEPNRARERESSHGGRRPITGDPAPQHSIMAKVERVTPGEEAPFAEREPAGHDRHAAA
jgi:hypothetical protein